MGSDMGEYEDSEWTPPDSGDDADSEAVEVEVEVEREDPSAPGPPSDANSEWDRAFDSSTPTGDLVPYRLTLRQWQFICNYLSHFNALRAAADAGYSTSSNAAGYQILQSPGVRIAIADILARRAQDYSAEHDRIIEALLIIAYSDPLDFCFWQGSIMYWTDLEKIPAHKRRAIRKIRRTETEGKYGMRYVTELEFEPRIKALELLMKHTGMLREQQSEDGRGAFRKWYDAVKSGQIETVKSGYSLPPVENGNEGKGGDAGNDEEGSK